MNFDDKTDIRIREEDLLRIEEIVNNNELYTSKSHFVRCAVLKLMREEEKKRNIGDWK